MPELDYLTRWYDGEQRNLGNRFNDQQKLPALARASDRKAPESVVHALFDLAVRGPLRRGGGLGLESRASRRGTWLHRLLEPAGSGRAEAPMASA